MTMCWPDWAIETGAYRSLLKNPDCLKCGVCVLSCPATALKLEVKTESQSTREICA
ncbi:hypothetical protein [Thermosediminibacter oceani]|uniref:hypothetical protein n=1 Tax=Thermosediminibacter oceani TaxID=291990 RepID=UPI00165115A5|nr:hypothetical protein [Thermosediminibacter oceani]